MKKEILNVNGKEIEIISKPNQHIETMIYNKADKRIAEIMEWDNGYHVEYFKLGNGGEYVREMRTYNTETYACAVLAAKSFVNTGEITK